MARQAAKKTAKKTTPKAAAKAPQTLTTPGTGGRRAFMARAKIGRAHV